MNKNEFKGNLQEINPSLIVSETTKKPIESFFLVLSVMYNDLKGLILFKKSITDNYRPSNRNELSSHSGELGGVIVQIDRLIIGNIHEFLKYIEENEEIVSSDEFKLVLEKTNSTIKSMWKDIIDVVFGNNDPVSEFKKGIVRIRSNAVFHYSDKELRKAFINIFFKRQKIAHNEKAFYSIGESMEETRFYYADATVEEYLRMMANEDEKDLQPKSVEGYSPELLDIVKKMNFSIMGLLKAYLKIKSKSDRLV